MKRLVLALLAAAAIAGCGSSDPPGVGYVRAPARSCALAYAMQHHIQVSVARQAIHAGRIRCRLVWAFQ